MSQSHWQRGKAGPMLARVFEKYATGTLSLKELVLWARDEGVGSKNGKPFTKSGLHHILRTPLYCGEFAWNGTTHRGLHTPLVSKESGTACSRFSAGGSRRSTGR